MQTEADPVICAMQKVSFDDKIYGMRVVRGELYGEPVGVVVCGVGKVNAARGTQYAVEKLGAYVIINIGVAGGLNSAMSIGGIYAVSAAVQYDFDLTQLNGTEIGTLDECKENYLSLPHSDAYTAKKLGTGDRFNDSKEDFLLLTEKLGADVRDMEGAAIAQVCMHCGIKCYQYKIISDIAGSGVTTDEYSRNLGICVERLKSELPTILKISI